MFKLQFLIVRRFYSLLVPYMKIFHKIKFDILISTKTLCILHKNFFEIKSSHNQKFVKLIWSKNLNIFVDLKILISALGAVYCVCKLPINYSFNMKNHRYNELYTFCAQSTFLFVSNCKVIFWNVFLVLYVHTNQHRIWKGLTHLYFKYLCSSFYCT